jgi:hypothetical protein
VRKATQLVWQAKQGYYAYTQDDKRPLSMSTLNRMATKAGTDVTTFLHTPKYLQGAGVGYYQFNDNPSNKPNAEDPQINQYFLTLVHNYGLNRQQAFDVTAKAFPGWGSRNRGTFFPKGEAPQGGATGASYQATTPQGAMQYAYSKMRSYGWGPQEFAALQQLWNGESGWDYTARNPSSGALGIPQALGHTLPGDYSTNPTTQIDWGMRYIKQRYGSPTRALAFWQANSPHWY